MKPPVKKLFSTVPSSASFDVLTVSGRVDAASILGSERRS